MQILLSARARPELRPYVRAYAQRKVEALNDGLTESVPAQLEQILNFEFGEMPGIFHDGQLLADRILLGGAHTEFSGYLELKPGVESFAVFFQPAGWSRLFGGPICEMTNQFTDVTAIVPGMRALWNRLGEVSSFDTRVQVVEQFLSERLSAVKEHDRITAAASYMFCRRGGVRIAEVANRYSLGLRQFERMFEREAGLSPKTFARIARFQAALDAKLAAPHRTWLEIAHQFGYYDQMHMVHDFERLGRTTPSQLIAEMGDVRPPALTAAEK